MNMQSKKAKLGQII